MKQIKFTSANFMPQQPEIPDAVMHDTDLADLKKLAGIAESSCSAPVDTSGMMSPLTNQTTGNAVSKYDYEKKNNIEPGSDDWFRLWFAKPGLTQEKPIGKKEIKNTLFSKPPKK